jgi:hypothetical protein
MADGDLILKLDDETSRRLKEAAEAAGRPVSEYAAELIGVGLNSDWTESIAALAEYDRTGVSYSLEEGMAAFDAAVEARFGQKA